MAGCVGMDDVAHSAALARQGGDAMLPANAQARAAANIFPSAPPITFCC